MSQLSIKKLTKIKINNIEFNYVKVGNGPQTLLLLPGTLGTVDQYKFLISMFDKKKYTIIVMEPMGYGYSRPPDRDFPPQYHYRDADYAISFMEALRVDKYSVLGWCDGGTTALIVASKAVDRVEKLVVWGCKAYVTVTDIRNGDATRDINKWVSEDDLSVYGYRYVFDTWNACVDSIHAAFRDNGGDICRAALPRIVAPTLIAHGEQDNIVSPEHAAYIHKRVKGSSLEIFPTAGHGLHFKCTEEFYTKVEAFLSSTKQTQININSKI